MVIVHTKENKNRQYTCLKRESNLLCVSLTRDLNLTNYEQQISG